MKVNMRGLEQTENFLKNLRKSVREATLRPPLPTRLHLELGNSSEQNFLEKAFVAQRQGSKVMFTFRTMPYEDKTTDQAHASTEDIINRVLYGSEETAPTDINAKIKTYVERDVVPEIVSHIKRSLKSNG